MFGLSRKEKEYKQKKIIDVLSNYMVGEWIVYDKKSYCKIEKRANGYVLLNDKRICVRLLPDLDYDESDYTRAGRKKVLKEIDENSEWGKILKLNELYHQALLMEIDSNDLRFKKIAYECTDELKKLEKEKFEEEGTKNAFEILKDALERNVFCHFNILEEESISSSNMGEKRPKVYRF